MDRKFPREQRACYAAVTEKKSIDLEKGNSKTWDDHREKGVATRLWGLGYPEKNSWISFNGGKLLLKLACKSWWLSFQEHGEPVFQQSLLKVKLVKLQLNELYEKEKESLLKAHHFPNYFAIVTNDQNRHLISIIYL